MLTRVAQFGPDAGSAPGELECLGTALVVGVRLEVDRDESGGRLARGLGEQQTGVRISEQVGRAEARRLLRERRDLGRCSGDGERSVRCLRERCAQPVGPLRVLVGQPQGREHGFVAAELALAEFERVPPQLTRARPYLRKALVRRAELGALLAERGRHLDERRAERTRPCRGASPAGGGRACSDCVEEVRQRAVGGRAQEATGSASAGV